VKILLLEDDKFIAEQIIEYFKLCEYEVVWFDNGINLIENAPLSNCDIMILDINTPGLNGIEVLKSIRAFSINTPALFITAMGDINYLKDAYRSGCNDYIRKPFDLEELEVRIKHLVYGYHSPLKKINSSYTFNMENQILYQNGNIMKLTNREKRLLYILLKREGEIVDKDEIKEYIWQDSVCDNTLRTAIKKLRDKLNDDIIKNIRGEGYTIIQDTK